jgi:FkbM family methyltransferase
MSFLEAVHFYYPLFGIRGLCMAAVARLNNRYPQVAMSVDGIDAPIYVRWRTTDLSVFRQVFVTGEYDCELPHGPKVIVDAGANVGLTTILYANKYPAARILAIEPESSNFEILIKNVKTYSQVTVLQAALWGINTTLQLVDPGIGHYGFRTGSISDSQGGRQRVEAFTVGAIMKKFDLERIDLLKVDIEGAEQEVFGDCESWIDRVDAVVIETHDRFRPRSSEVVFGALVDFDIRWQVGETLYFARSSRVSECFQPGSVRSGHRGHHIGRSSSLRRSVAARYSDRFVRRSGTPRNASELI